MDITNLWLPYTQHGLAPAPLDVVDAEGCTLKLADGTKLIDGISSWWTVCHGYKHPQLVKAIQDQAQTLSHVMMGGIVHEQAVKLSARLAKLTKLPKIFFSDSGSTAVEVAMKMAVQFYKNQNKNTHRCKFLHFKNSYHGDTMGAMSISDPESIHSHFGAHVPMQFMTDIPSDEFGFGEFDKLVNDFKGQLAGIIVEPLVQMAGGFKFHSPDVLAEIYRICKKHEVLFIADEIATGFGRTGYMFACEEAGITPDIMCIGKALTGGMVGLAATCASEEVFSKFTDTNPEHAFMHGPTYMGNALACAAANASLDLFEKENRLEQVSKIEEILSAELAKCKTLPNVKDVRVKGAIGVVELEKVEDKYALREKFIKQSVFIRPLENCIYLAPPLVISDKELKQLTAAIFTVLEK